MSREDHASLREVRVEIAAVVKQIDRVEFNSNAVEAAIAGKGTYRGYSGEDVFLKSNLRVVQREMMKQLRRTERSLTHRKRRLEAKLGLAELASQNPQPAATAVGEAPNGGGSASPLPPPEPPRRGSPSPRRKTIAALSKSVPARLPAVIVPAEKSDRSRNPRPKSCTSAPEPTPPSQVASTTLVAGAQPRPTPPPTETVPPTAPPTAAAVPTSAAATPSESAAAPADQNATPTIDTQGMVEIMAQQAFAKYAASAKPTTGTTTAVGSGRKKKNGAGWAAVVPVLFPKGKGAAAPAPAPAPAPVSVGATKSSGSGNVALGPNSGGGGRGGAPASKRDRSKLTSPVASSEEKASAAVSLRKKPEKRKYLNASPVPRSAKSSRRGTPVPGPAHSVQEYLANTQRGTAAVASVKKGTVFWIKFSDTKEAWLECGVVKKVHERSAVPYEVEWRPFDSTGCHLALNPKKRIALTPRLYVTSPDDAKAKVGRAVGPPAGTKDRDGFELSTKVLMLNVPPIGSWCIAKANQPWGKLGPFAF